mmetsp:Transcript_23046/g.32155  ORF Transcript_23046/g.32155 Transcript_23046/m.32155 type:complete len:118 (+) Transcript_23046:450-803(+)
MLLQYLLHFYITEIGFPTVLSRLFPSIQTIYLNYRENPWGFFFTSNRNHLKNSIRKFVFPYFRISVFPFRFCLQQPFKYLKHTKWLPKRFNSTWRCIVKDAPKLFVVLLPKLQALQT